MVHPPGPAKRVVHREKVRHEKVRREKVRREKVRRVKVRRVKVRRVTVRRPETVPPRASAGGLRKVDLHPSGSSSAP